MVNKKLFFFIRFFFYVFLSGITAYYISSYVDSKVISSTLSTLQNISAAVFTLSGLWIAIIYPEALKSYANKNVSLLKGNLNTRRIEHLIVAVSSSAFVLLSILVFNFLYSIAVKTEWFSLHKQLLEQIFCFYFFFIIILQATALLQIISNGLFFALELYKRAEDAERDKDL